jgi:hypothetical protein
MLSFSDDARTDGADPQSGHGEEGRLEARLARQGRRLRRLEKLLLEQAATLDLHSEALLLLIRQQLGASQDDAAGPSPTGGLAAQGRSEDGAPIRVRMPRVG